MEASSDAEKNQDASLQQIAETVFRNGKPVSQKGILMVPLVVRNTGIGVACFFRNPKIPGDFLEKEISLAVNLSSQAATALKNILLFEDNLRMERLAAIGQTMGMVLHEIKNIVQLAKFAEEYVRMGIDKKSENYLNKGVEGMRKAIREMDGFTYEVLSLTKNYKIQPELINPAHLLEELKMDLESRAAQYKVKLQLEKDPALSQVEGESRSLYRTLLNLVKNAIEAADAGKPDSFVRVSFLSKDKDRYQILVEDNGKGMSDEAKAKIFQAFFSTKGEKGTGLGLLVIDRTVKAHQGEIKVESEFGKGTKFILSLPKVLPKD